MSDNRAWVYWDADSNAYVYRASSLGSCIRSLTAARLGEDVFPFNASIRAAMDASSGLEDEIIRRFKIEMASDEVIWAQKEVQLSVPPANCPKCGTDLESVTGLKLDHSTVQCRECGRWTEPNEHVIVRGHLDGMYQLDDSVLEIKALGTTNFEKYMTGLSKRNSVLDGLDALGTLGDKYRLQLGCYGHATQRKVRLVVGHKVRTSICTCGHPQTNHLTIGGECRYFADAKLETCDCKMFESRGFSIEEVDISPPMDPSDLYSLSDLHARIQFIEECAAKDELPDCDANCREGDPYSEAHLFTGPTTVYGELEELIRNYAALKREEDDLKERKDNLRERIISEYGIGKYATGPYTARVEHVKPTQRVDSKKLRKLHPDVWEECSTMGAPTIRLTVTGGDKRDA